MQVPVKIYVKNHTQRHHYIFDVFFRNLLGCDYVYVEDIGDCHINYSVTSGSGVNCIPYGLLEESTLSEDHKQAVEFKTWNTSWCFYKTSEDLLPFDIFSAAFFLLTRYEEYLPYKPDEHNRFPATASVLVQQNKISEPLINQWALLLRDILVNQFDELKFSSTTFKFLSTLDIDQAWKFKNKGLLRSILGTVRDIKEKKWENFKDRWPVLLGLKRDPFDQFGWNAKLEQQYNFETIYFFLLSDYGKFDKNISHKNTNFRKLIQQVSRTNKLGIHPSYLSNGQPSRISIEIDRLSDIIASDIILSRQHFLLHSMPQTYNQLIQNGIKEDHTMGYSTHLGFRAGIASPFLWFDLRENKTTELKLTPFCAMDITPLHYLQQTPEEAIVTLNKLMNKVAKVGGYFVTLWHNESLSETERWKGWKKVYSAVVNKANQLGAR